MGKPDLLHDPHFGGSGGRPPRAKGPWRWVVWLLLSPLLALVAASGAAVLLIVIRPFRYVERLNDPVGVAGATGGRCSCRTAVASRCP
jgi:hypothetical protein